MDFLKQKTIHYASSRVAYVPIYFLTHRQFEGPWCLGVMGKIQLLGTSRVRLDKEKFSEKPPSNCNIHTRSVTFH